MIADRQGLLIRAGKKDSFYPLLVRQKSTVNQRPYGDVTKKNNKFSIYSYFIFLI